MGSRGPFLLNAYPTDGADRCGRKIWELFTEGPVLLKWPESGHNWGTGFLGGCGEGAGQIRMEGCCVWPFRGVPTPVRRDLCI